MRSGRQPSVMAHQFSQVPNANIPRSSFDRSHGLKTTFNETGLVPIFVDEVLPGDTFIMNSTLFGRLATPLFPVMDNMYLDVFYFFVPYRLVWSHFVNFFGEQDNPTDTTSYLVPQTTVPVGATTGWLYDYFGIPVAQGSTPGYTISALPFRAYNLVWNQWFRDENLQNSVIVQKDDGPDPATNYASAGFPTGVLPRGKRKDYFTSCLPWPQKGPAVQLPLGVNAPVYTAPSLSPFTAANALILRNAATGAVISTSLALGTTASDGHVSTWSSPAVSTVGVGVQPANLYTDLSNATAATINQLRQAFQIQKIYERDARGGTRYIELIKSHFGVTSPDARLQRSEYLGGGSCPLNVNPIAQTSATGVTGATTPLGNLAAMGTVSNHGVGFSKSFTEHGVIIGLVNLRADLNYQDGIERFWSRQTRFDFYWPALSHIGEQGVLNREIWSDNTANDQLVFGYQERYAEYRYKPSRITGAFRSVSAQPLDTWHLAQHFTALPLLNAAFIQDAPPISRIVAVPSQPRILLDVYHQLRCSRPMPVYGVPGLIDHF